MLVCKVVNTQFLVLHTFIRSNYTQQFPKTLPWSPAPEGSESSDIATTQRREIYLESTENIS